MEARDFWGEDYPNAFQLSSRDRNDLFQFIGESDQSVLNNFEQDLDKYYVDQADQAFSEDDGKRLKDIGRLEAAVKNGYNAAAVDEAKSEDEQAATAARIKRAGANAALTAPLAYFSSPTIVAAGTTGSSATFLVPDPPETADRVAQDVSYDGKINGTRELRHLVMTRALNYEGDGGAPGYGDIWEKMEEEQGKDEDGNIEIFHFNNADWDKKLDAIEPTYHDELDMSVMDGWDDHYDEDSDESGKSTD